MRTKALRILASDGPLVMCRRAVRKLRRGVSPVSAPALPVCAADVVRADWRSRKANDHVRARAGDGPLQVNWVIPPIGRGSGGHHTILRFVRALEASGHRCNLFVYDGRGIQSAAETRAILRRHFGATGATVSTDLSSAGHCDALIATAWQTAYPVFNLEGPAHRFYFVQDYEPAFYPVGTESILAENSYRLGLHGITAGTWLKERLSSGFGMRCEHFDFGIDRSRYRRVGDQPRDAVVFYARPVTPRRGFELGVLTLALFAEQHPEYEIHTVGSDLDGVRLPFPAVAHGVLDADELNALYNRCAAALVISLTNMSLLPLELLAAGCTPVVNDGPNNRMVSDNPFILYGDAAPHALAGLMAEAVTRPGLAAHAERAAASVRDSGWDQATAGFERILLRTLAEPSRHGAEPVEAQLRLSA